MTYSNSIDNHTNHLLNGRHFITREEALSRLAVTDSHGRTIYPMQDDYTSPLFPCSGSGEPRLGTYNRATIVSMAVTILGPLAVALIGCSITHHYYTFLTLGINPALGYSGLSLLTIASAAMVFNAVCAQKRRAYLEEELDHVGLKAYLDMIKTWAGDLANDHDNSYKKVCTAKHIQRAFA